MMDPENNESDNSDGDAPTETVLEDVEDSNQNKAAVEIPKEDVMVAMQRKLESSQFVLLRYVLEPMHERVGLLGEHSYLYVTYLDAEGNERNCNFFIKFFPKLESSARFAEGIGAFKKEMFVYKLLEEFHANGIDIVKPVTARCYFSKYNEYFFLENLNNLGYEVFDKQQTLDYDTVLVILQNLAKFHASTIIFEEKVGKNLLDLYPDDFEESFFNDKDDFINLKGVEACIKCVVKEIELFNFPTKLRSGRNFPRFAEELCYKVYDLVRPSRKFKNVLAHGDLWATNFLLKRDSKTNKPIGCKFIDFQCGRYVPPAQDVLALLYLTTTREFRKSYLYEVVGTYYSYLERHLKMSGIDAEEVIPFAYFMNSCEEQKLFAIVQTAIYFPLILINNDEVETYLTDELFEDRSYMVLSYMDKDENYKKRLIDSIEDLKEYCEYL